MTSEIDDSMLHVITASASELSKSLKLWHFLFLIFLTINFIHHIPFPILPASPTLHTPIFSISTIINIHIPSTSKHNQQSTLPHLPHLRNSQPSRSPPTTIHKTSLERPQPSKLQSAEAYTQHLHKNHNPISQTNKLRSIIPRPPHSLLLPPFTFHILQLAKLPHILQLARSSLPP